MVTQAPGYGRSNAVTSVKSLIEQSLSGLKFPATGGKSIVVVPVLVPIPELEPIEIVVPHDVSRDAMCKSTATQVGHVGELALRGGWEGDLFKVREPIAGSIRVEPRHVTVHF